MSEIVGMNECQKGMNGIKKIVSASKTRIRLVI